LFVHTLMRVYIPDSTETAMVFFTAMLVIIIIYYLQVDGLIYATIVALVAELLNIFMAHTLTKSVEKKMKLRIRRLVDSYSKRIKAQRKTIGQLEKIQEESVTKLYNANLKIKEYEAKLGIMEAPPTGVDKTRGAVSAAPDTSDSDAAPGQAAPPEKKQTDFSDLPSGSNRRKLPF
jgi:hypothetical protein